MSLRFHIEFASSSLRFHFDFTLISIRLHFDFTSDSLRFHIDSTSSSLRFHFDFTLISIRFHFDFTSDSLRVHFDFTSNSLRLSFDLTSISHGEKGTRHATQGKRENSAGQKGKGKTPSRDLSSNSTWQPDRAHARTKRNDFPVGVTPQPPIYALQTNNQLYKIYIYIYIYISVSRLFQCQKQITSKHMI
jgi:hypothetical protein